MHKKMNAHTSKKYNAHKISIYIKKRRQLKQNHQQTLSKVAVSFF